MSTVWEYLRYLFLGIFQGVTEPLPISSSGHLIILRALFDMPAVDFFFEVVLHFASFLAIVFLFRKKLVSLVQGNIDYFLKRDKESIADVHYVLKIALAAIPAGLIGFVFKGWFEDNVIAQGLWPVGVALYVTALFLFLVQRRSIENTQTQITYIDALVIGLFQVVALFPGISRSGSTLVGGFYRKVELHSLIEFSFLLYLPIAFFSMLLELVNITTMNHPVIPLLLSFVMSGVFTYWALKWFVGLVQKGQLNYFGFYCIGAGSLALILSFMGF